MIWPRSLACAQAVRHAAVGEPVVDQPPDLADAQDQLFADRVVGVFDVVAAVGSDDDAGGEFRAGAERVGLLGESVVGDDCGVDPRVGVGGQRGRVVDVDGDVVGEDGDVAAQAAAAVGVDLDVLVAGDAGW